MKLLSCVSLLVVGGLFATPCFSAEKKMKNEPKTIAGLTCGDTPFKFFKSEEYLGRQKMFGCSKIYRKNDILYNFNSRGQLFKVGNSCDTKEIKAFTKKHGEPTSKQKSGNDRYEGTLYKWVGNNVEAVFYTTTSNSPGSFDICMADYYCKKIEATDQGDCSPQDLSYQANKVDEFVKALGVDIAKREPGTTDKEYAPFVESVKRNAKALGFPKEESITFYQYTGDYDHVCMMYKTGDGSKVKKVLYEKVGDISDNNDNPALIGNASSIRYQDMNQILFQNEPVNVQVCFTGKKD